MINLANLLNREEVILDTDKISEILQGKTVLVTGAGGSIGSEICRQVLKYEPAKLILLGHGENSIFEILMELNSLDVKTEIVSEIADIQDEPKIDDVFNKHEPHIVYHAAAHKHVPLMESHPSEAIKNNVIGTTIVMQAAHQHNAERAVMISTDKAVNPTSVMGATKRTAEMLIQAVSQHSKTKFSVVRFGNVLGSRGSVIPTFLKLLENDKPLTITDPDITRYFMTIPEASRLVIQSSALAEGGEVFILDMGEPVKILDLAHKLIKETGKEDTEIIITGLRPGEKVYEELTYNKDILKTDHKGIFVEPRTEIDINDLDDKLYDLLTYLYAPDIEIKQNLKNIVPTYNF